MNDTKDPSGRRQFLGTSLGATTAVLAGWRPSLASPLGANDRIRIGVIGTGGRARSLMKQLVTLPGQEIVAVSDVFEPRMLEAAEIAGGGVAKIPDYRRILDDKEIHAVLIGAPDHWHKTMTLEAVAAGKDVYVEKPVAHSIEEGAAMRAGIEASKQVVQTGTQQRSWDHWILGKEIVDSGRLGQVTFVNTYWYQLRSTQPLPSIDVTRLDWKRWLGPARDQPFDAERFLRWRHFKDFGGGVLTDLLTHWIDVVHWYMGVDTPLSAVATGRNYLMKTWEWPDAVTATLEYPRDFMVTHTGTYGSSIDDGGLEIRGDRGTLKIDRERLAVYSEDRPASGSRFTPEPEILVRSLGDGSVSHLRNWLDCIRSRKAPNAPIRVGQQAARAAQIANAALGARGGRVRFDEKTGKVEPL
ncbi:MAG TPA: Gfo/Idh/MocA family oxidoreductase [Vicinamibacteria bacterium]|nr:Gfo/Idh/MocA family oxidoreductase [Vicinamibacteria bacterium]